MSDVITAEEIFREVLEIDKARSKISDKLSCKLWEFDRLMSKPVKKEDKKHGK